MDDAYTEEKQISRMTVALGVMQWEVSRSTSLFSLKGTIGDLTVQVGLIIPDYTLRYLSFGAPEFPLTVHCWAKSREWTLGGTGEHSELMVRGLYLLGFDDESILSQLPALTAHEKLELRLSMPRDFWPSHWIEEGVNTV